MYDSKLIQLLKTLDSGELKAFEKYLMQRYKEQETVIKLFNHIKTFAPSFSHKKLDKAYILTKVLGLSEGPAKRISNESSKLTGWLEEFLILQAINKEENAYAKERLLVGIYKERQVEHFFYQKVEALKKQIWKEEKSLWHCLQLLEITHEYYYCDLTQKNDKQKDKVINDLLVLLAKFYEVLKQKYECEKKSRQAILKNGGTMPEDNTDLPYNQAHMDLIYHIYTEALHMIPDYDSQTGKVAKKVDVEAFFRSKQLLINGASELVEEDRRVILAYLINYTAHGIRNAPNNDLSWYNEVYELYQYGLSNKLITIEKDITRTTFHNIVNIACELDQLGWCFEFISSYKAVWGHENEDYITLANARLLFEQGKYAETLETLKGPLVKDDDYVDIQKRLLQVRCNFELLSRGDDAYEVFTNGIRSCNTFLERNNNLGDPLITGCKNFLKLLSTIESERFTKQELIQKLESTSNIVARPWLLKVIARQKK